MREKMLEVADRLRARADARYTNAWRQYWRDVELEPTPPPYPKEPVADALIITADEIYNVLTPAKLEPLLTEGDVFTVAQFREHCLDGAFVDSDGEGWYGNEEMKSNKPARPSQIAGDDVDENFTHVHWYNK